MFFHTKVIINYSLGIEKKKTGYKISENFVSGSSKLVKDSKTSMVRLTFRLALVASHLFKIGEPTEIK